MKSIALLLISTLTILNTSALSTDSLKSRFEMNVSAGYAFNSNGELMKRMEESEAHKQITHTGLSFRLQYALSGFGDESTRSVYQGVGVGVTTFSAPRNVGTPVSIYVLQGAPFAILSDKISLGYEWNFGFAPGWHKSTTGFNLSSNLVVGSSTNAYINLGVKASWAVAPEWSLSGGLDLTHFSNGNTSWPNPGVNTVGARVGIAYTPGVQTGSLKTPFSHVYGFQQGMVYDIMAFGAWRKSYFPYERGGFDSVGEAYLLPGHFAVAGLSFSPLWKFHPRFRAGLSADFQWGQNEGLIQDNYDYIVPSPWKQMSLGLSARAELVMPIFSVNVGLGYGVVGPWETRMFYQTLTLKTYVWRGAYLNVGYKLHKFRSPSNLMLGVGYTIGH